MVSRGVEKTNQAQRAKHYNEFAAMKVIVFFLCFLGCGFKTFFEFAPRSLGRWTTFDEHVFF